MIFRMYLFVFLLIIITISEASAQLSQHDTVLYLLFDKDKHYKYADYVAIDPIIHKEHPENVYALQGEYYLYSGYPLEFISIRKENADTVHFKDLEKLSIVTPEQLRQFIVANYDRKGTDDIHYKGEPYFNHLKHIYLVEKEKKKRIATLTEVKLNVHIE